MGIFNRKVQTIAAIHSLGGCGGTLLAQCIGALQDVVLLSECNPLSASLFDYNLNPYVQIKKWHPELFNRIKDKFQAEDLEEPKAFRKFIIKVKSLLDKQKHHLIIRDYNYIDYFGVPFLSQPPMYSSLLKALEKSFHVKKTILVRHPLTQYNSLRSHDILKNTLSPSLFLNGYHAFLADFAGCKIIKYEDIVSHPYESISDLSQHLDVPFAKDFLEKFHNNQAVTGNFKRVGEAKISLSNQTILEDPWTEELRNSPRYQLLLNALNYERVG